MGKHTEGHLIIDHGVATDASGVWMFYMSDTIKRDFETNQANLKRAVDCWNACYSHGLDNPDEDISGLVRLWIKAARERDELLSHLRCFEWSGDETKQDAICPVCNGNSQHYGGCALGTTLAKHNKSQ